MHILCPALLTFLDLISKNVLVISTNYKVRLYINILFLLLPHSVQTGSRAHPASYPMGTRGAFLGSKVAGARG
jgi:hypothetical protein